MRTTTLVIGVLAVLLASTGDSHATQTVCVSGNWGPAPRTLQVYVNQGTASIIGLTDAQLGAAVSRAVTIWNEESGAPLKLDWQGVQSFPGGKKTGAVVVNGGIQTNGYGLAQTSAQITGGVFDWAFINVWNRMGDDTNGYHTLTWVQDRENSDIFTSYNYDLVGVLVHEMGHAAFGLEHPDVDNQDDCAISPVPQSVMTSAVQGRGRFLRLWDMDKARYYDGDRAGYTILKWSLFSDSGGTWGTATNLLGQYIAYRFGSLSQSYAYTNLSWTQRNPTGTTFGQVRQMYYLTSDGSFNFQKTLSDSSSGLPAPVGVAASPSTNEVIVTYRKKTTDPLYSSLNTFVCYRKSSDGGQTFASEVCPSAATVSRYGLTAAYDPVTNVFLISEAYADGFIHVITVPGTGSSVPFHETAVGELSWHAPSIACRSSGTNNCRMVRENKDANGCLSWDEGHVDTATGIYVAPVSRSQCFLQWDTPSVAYHTVDDTFRLAYGSGNYAIYSYKMAGNGGTSWAGTGDVYNSPTTLISFPALATEWFCFFGCGGNLRTWFLKYY